MTDDSQIKEARKIETCGDGNEIPCIQPAPIALGLHADNGFLVQLFARRTDDGVEFQLEAIFVQCIAEDIAPVSDIGAGVGVDHRIARQ